MQAVTLKRLVTCDSAVRDRIREIRNQPSIRRAMVTDHVISAPEHAAWLAWLEDDKSRIDFAVLMSGQVAGAASVSRLDRRHRSCDWAFYLDEACRGGLGTALEFALLDFVFNRLEMEKLNCEVIETNAAVLRLHRKFGFVEEGFRRSQIEKDGRRLGMHQLGLTRSDWRAARDDLETSQAGILQRFTIEVGW